MEGYLHKQGEKGLIVGWKKRYFVLFLTDQRLDYFKDQSHAPPSPVPPTSSSTSPSSKSYSSPPATPTSSSSKKSSSSSSSSFNSSITGFASSAASPGLSAAAKKKRLGSIELAQLTAGAITVPLASSPSPAGQREGLAPPAGFEFQIATPGRVYRLIAPTDEFRTRWVEAVRGACLGSTVNSLLAASIADDEAASGSGSGSMRSRAASVSLSLTSIPTLTKLLRTSRDFETLLLTLRRLSRVLQQLPSGKMDNQLRDSVEECEKALQQVGTRSGVEECILRDVILCLSLLPRDLPGAPESAITVFNALKRGKQSNDPELPLTAFNCLLRLSETVPLFLFTDRSDGSSKSARGGSEPWQTISAFTERQRRSPSDACLRRKAVQLVGAFLAAATSSTPTNIPEKLVKDLVNILDARNNKQASLLDDSKKKPGDKKSNSSSSSSSPSTPPATGSGPGDDNEIDESLEYEETCNVLEVLCVLSSSEMSAKAVGRKAHILAIARHLDLNYDSDRTRALIETILVNLMKYEKMRTKLQKVGGGGRLVNVANSASPRDARWYFSRRQNAWTNEDPYHSASILIKAVLPGASASGIGTTTLSENLMTVFNQILDERYAEEQLPIRITVTDVVFPKVEDAKAISVIPYMQDDNTAAIEVDMKPKGFAVVIKASKGPLKVGMKVMDVSFKGKLLLGLSKKPGKLQPAWFSFAEVPTWSFSCEVTSLSVQVQKILTTVVESVIRNKCLHPKRFYIETPPADEIKK